MARSYRESSSLDIGAGLAANANDKLDLIAGAWSAAVKGAT